MKSFLSELTRRKVWLFGGIYLALGWVLLQVAVVIESTLSLPGWVDQITLILLGLGFPVALLLAWAQESAVTGSVISNAELGATPAKRPAMSIAILPFTNMSDERELAWIADGMSEDLSTRFSMDELMHVVARNSAFAWKGQSPDVRQVGETLNVSYVLEGSLRLVGETIRVTAQLIDTRTGDHVWAESYDHARSNLTRMQDEIVDAILAEARAALTSKEYARVRKTPPEELDALDICLLTDDMTYFPARRQGLVKATGLLEAARLKFPESHEVMAALALNYGWRSTDAQDERSEFEPKADEALRKALSLKSSSPQVIAAAVAVLRYAERHDESLSYAQKLGEQGVAIGGYLLGNALASHGKFVEARKETERWLALAGKRNFRREAALLSLATSHMGLGQFAEAERSYREALMIQPYRNAQLNLAAALAHQGKSMEAARALEIYKAMPGAVDFETYVAWLRRNYANDEFVAMMTEGVRLAGLE